MAYSKDLAVRIRKLLSKANVTEEIEMMGGLVYMVNGRMSIGINQVKETGADRLMLKLGQDEISRLTEEPACKLVDMGGRKMKSFVYVEASGFETNEALQVWLERALKYNLDQDV